MSRYKSTVLVQHEQSCVSVLRPSAHWVHTTWIDKVSPSPLTHLITDPSLAHRGIQVTSQFNWVDVFRATFLSIHVVWTQCARGLTVRRSLYRMPDCLHKIVGRKNAVPNLIHFYTRFTVKFSDMKLCHSPHHWLKHVKFTTKVEAEIYHIWQGVFLFVNLVAGLF